LAIKNKSKSKKEQVWVRYFFYVSAVALVLITGLYIYWYQQGIVSIDILEANTSITFSLAFPIFVVAYLMLRGWNLKMIIKHLGLSRDKFNVTALTTGIKLLAIIFAFEILISVFSQVTDVQLPTNVGTVLQGLPLYFLLFSFMIAPIDEEIFFRGYLIPWFKQVYTSVAEALSLPRGYEDSMIYVYRSGLSILSSAIIFAVLHAGYMSISEFFAALLFGLAAGYYYTKKGSLYATIFAHVMVNLLAITAFLALGATAVS